jgi:AbrB family looped-hinge helix DNA binding protein
MSGTTEKTRLVRPLRGGQITIPAEFRKSLGFDENTILRMTLKDGELRITPVQAEEPRKGSPGFRALYEHFAPVREEILALGVTQEELYADIDAAIAAVRAERCARLERES